MFRVGPTGSFRQTLLAAIDSAREVVLLASFLLADEQIAEAMERAAHRGVRVYALTASEHRLATLPKEDDAFEMGMVDQHKRLLDRLAGKVLLRSAEHFHAKFLVVDPAGAARGWVSTANFNLALQKSVELGLAVSPEWAKGLAGWFSWVFWREAERELVTKGRLAGVEQPPTLPREPTQAGVFVTTRMHQFLREEVLRLIRTARREVLVSSYGLEAGYPVVQALADKARGGVPVTVLTRPRPAVLPAIAALAAAGARIAAHDKLHAKAVVSDAGALVLTANLEAQGLEHGFEVGVHLEATAASALRSTLQEWAEDFPWTFSPSARRGDHLGEIWIADRRQGEGLREVIPEQSVPLAPVVAPSALDLTMAPTPSLKAPEPGQRLPKRLRFEWEVRPPRLPEKAKERRRLVRREEPGKNGKLRAVEVQESYEPPVFEHGGKLYVAVQTPEEFEPARRLAGELDATVVVR
ncbi:phospholipase D-like domain-containing protein [Archangium sp.]|uniref:phospholipase D-like domain-containing protein n=1 Tax=Archangium sp. TaxID=1872627 RepID=UPI002EDA3CE7